jgi:arabinofuranosyltransferase
MINKRQMLIFGLLWVCATSLGFLIGTTLNNFLYYIYYTVFEPNPVGGLLSTFDIIVQSLTLGLILGVCVSFVQGLVVRKWVPNIKQWIGMNILGWWIGFPIIRLIDFSSSYHWSIEGLAHGIIIGGVGWFVLRKYFKYTGWWILLWFVLGIFSLGTRLDRGSDEPGFIAILGAIVGVFTGAMLIFLFHHPRTAPATNPFKNYRNWLNKISSFLNPLNQHPVLIKVTFAILALVYLFFVVQRAWVTDDAYITLRVVDNFRHGYGLVWNTFERVQAFTHPLWLFVLTVGISLTQEYFYTTMAVSVLLCAATLGVLYRFGLKSVSATFLVFALLITSNTYLDYSTSGLDNALSHFLLVLFFLLLTQLGPSRRKLFWVSFVASCGLVNRLDTIVIFLPGMLYLLYEHRAALKDWWLAGLAQSPIIAWELFALIYYGFPFPNTAYAKLYTGIAGDALVRQGWLYLSDSFTYDPTTLLACSLAFLFALKSGKSLIQYVLPVSIGLFILYDIQIGGDFMRGRFLTLPLVCAALIVLTTQNQWITRFGMVIALVFVLVNLNSASPFYKANTEGKISADGIADERGYYLHSNSLYEKFSKPESELPNHKWVEDGKRLRLNPPASGAVVIESIGMAGFYAGPEVKIIDPFGLSDPLLARLPLEKNARWRIGHFKRSLPWGYLETVNSGTNTIRDRDMQISIYYEILKLITQAPLFARDRIEVIVNMNLGEYEHLIRQGNP